MGFAANKHVRIIYSFGLGVIKKRRNFHLGPTPLTFCLKSKFEQKRKWSGSPNPSISAGVTGSLCTAPEIYRKITSHNNYLHWRLLLHHLCEWLILVTRIKVKPMQRFWGSTVAWGICRSPGEKRKGEMQCTVATWKNQMNPRVSLRALNRFPEKDSCRSATSFC